jgi:long-chain acyl-CoA synthetase
MTLTRAEALAVLTAPTGPFATAEQVIGDRRIRAYQVGPQTLRQVLETTRSFGSADYLVYEGERYTFAEHYRLVAGLAEYLADHYRIGKGDRIAIAMRNYPEFALFLWASIALGAIAVPLNAWWTEGEISAAITDSGTALLVADQERLQRLGALAVGRLHLRGVIAIRCAEPVEGAMPFHELRAKLRPDATMPSVDIAPEDLVTILYTSGTTGSPRGVMHTHRNHCTNILNVAISRAWRPLAQGHAPEAEQHQAAALGHMPLFHISQLSSLCVSAAIGGRVVLLHKWNAEKALDAIEQERLTSFTGVPLHYQDLLESPTIKSRDLSSVRTVGFAATVAPPPLVLRVRTLFGERVEASTAYGMTEATSGVTFISGADYLDHPDSVGWSSPVNDVKVVDTDGNELPAGAAGELWVRGPNIVNGYWNRPVETKEAFTDGWHHSGDVATIGDSGLVRLVDRIKDVVIRGGENVFCGEVEAVLHSHPAVRTAAVFGLPHDRLGEEVVAVVNHRPDSALDAHELMAYAGERLARFKVPSRIFFVDHDLPRTATGKIMKRAIRNQANDGTLEARP